MEKMLLVSYSKVLVGGDDIEARVSWKLPQEFKASKLSRWWDSNIESRQDTKFNPSEWENKVNTRALYDGITVQETIVGKAVRPTTSMENNEKWFIHNPIFQWPTTEENIMAVCEDKMYHHMTLWEDTDFTDWNDKFAPTNITSLTSRIPALQYKQTTKSTMTEYPMYARPVLTKAANQEFNAITGRIYKVETYRRHNYDLDREMQLFLNTYFSRNCGKQLDHFNQEELNFNEGRVLEWLRLRPDASKIAAELVDILETGFETNPINDIKVHIKLESLLKEEPVSDLRQVKARTIMWQCKGYCSMFGHIFNEVKQRLKDVLRKEVVYADGLRADELTSLVRNIDSTSYLLENDLSQQDRQTDHEIIDFEMKLYKLLGVNGRVVDLWRRCHNTWKMKAATLTGYSDAMRLSGQATTALGNAITNMLVHRRLVQKLGESLRLFLLLGDDGLMCLKTRVDTGGLNHELKVHHNMMCKPKLSKISGTFCCMVVNVNSDGTCDMGPDFIRLRRRFEVTNGVSEANDANLTARCMSYCMMLGPLVQVVDLIKEQNWPIEPIKWYNYDNVVNAICDKYDCTIAEVENNIVLLVSMMKNRTVYLKTIDHLIEKY